MWMKHMMEKKAGAMAAKMMWEPETISASTKVLFTASLLSILFSVITQMQNKKEKSIWIGLWAPTFLLLGIYDRAYRMMKLFSRL